MTGWTRARWERAVLLATSIAWSCACSTSTPAPCEPASSPPASAPPDVALEKAGPSAESQAPSLSLWNEGASREAIASFVEQVTDEEGPGFVPEAERIAVFDNDGTLWSENPMYVQLAFTLDRVEELAPQHPEWKGKQPFQAVLDGDLAQVAQSGNEGLMQLVAATHGGMSVDEFDESVREWLAKAKHPKYQRPYTELTYAPMVQLLDYLRAHGFKTFIVSGGGVDFMRPFTQAVYGIPPEQVVGSRMEIVWQEQDGKGALMRNPKLEFIDDGPGKPVGIQNMIGRQPILAAGNSDGDLQMLEWTLDQDRPRLALLVHHTDAEREAAYDRDSPFGRLDRALDAATAEGAAAAGWVPIDMKADWKKVFSFEP